MLLVELHCRLSYVYTNAVVETGVLVDPVRGRLKTPDLHKEIKKINEKRHTAVKLRKGTKLLTGKQKTEGRK